MPQNTSFRTLADKYKVGGEFHDRLKQRQVENIDVKPPVVVVTRKKSPGVKRYIGLVLLLTLLMLAALKNPSPSEAKVEIKNMIIERVNELASSDSSEFEISWLESLFLPTLLDNVFQIKVADYVFFSTFNIILEEDEEYEETLVCAGIILYGKIIPLISNIKKA